MNILLLADLHDREMFFLNEIYKINENKYDVIILLGDISELILEELSEHFKNKKRIFGILGNHDRFGVLDNFSIENINNKVIEIDGIKFGGIEGSFKYKYAHYPAYTHSESLEILNVFDYVDVLISHTGPYGLHERNKDTHCGLLGITEYIKNKRPVYNLHGHQHFNQTTVLDNDTTVIGVYGLSILNLLTGELENIT